MPLIKESSIRDLKDRISIEEVVSPMVQLQRVGSLLRGLSPFNPEKTPSFYVSPERNTFTCYSSNKSGDIVSFLMETERLSFSEAVETLAQRFGIPLEYESGGPDMAARSIRQQILDLHEEAAQFFHRNLMAGAPLAKSVRHYWTDQRLFSMAVAEEFRIGLADPSGMGLGAHLACKGFSAEAMKESGLFYAPRSENRVERWPCRFRGRLMIPIRDIQGRVCAFTARQLECTPRDDPSCEAKYINSPETPVFSKGRLLFNLDRARVPSRSHPFLLVEGQLDAIRCHTCGLTTAVAPQGTAITEWQLQAMKRLQTRIEVLLDGDDAGQKAVLRLFPLAAAEGLDVTVLPLQAGEDPDSLLREKGPSVMERLRGKSISAAKFACLSLLPEPHKASPAAKQEAARAYFGLIAGVESGIARIGYLEEAAEAWRVPLPELQAEWQRFQSRRPEASGRKSKGLPENPSNPMPLLSAESILLLLCLKNESMAKEVARIIDLDCIDTSTLDGGLLARFLAAMAHDNWPGSAAAADELVETRAESEYLMGLEFANLDHDEPHRVANTALSAIHRRCLDRKIDELKLEIARKGGMFDADHSFLLQKLHELQRQRVRPPSISASNI